jgi:hypothetical protein
MDYPQKREFFEGGSEYGYTVYPTDVFDGEREIMMVQLWAHHTLPEISRLIADLRHLLRAGNESDYGKVVYSPVMRGEEAVAVDCTPF